MSKSASGMGETLGRDDKTIVDVLFLEDFRSTLDARLGEAQSVQTSLNEALRDRPPQLGTLEDAAYVSERYQTLYGQHVDRVGALIGAITAAREAMTSIIDNYRATETQLTDSATAIGGALDGVNVSGGTQVPGGGAPGGEPTNAG